MKEEICEKCMSGELQIACEVCKHIRPDRLDWEENDSEQTEKLNRRQLEPWRDPARNGDLL